MNQERHGNRNLAILLTQLNHRDLHQIVTFLDSQTISNIMHSMPHPSKNRSNFLEVVRIRYFIQNYLTKTDRSIYMPFYAEESFLKIEYDLLRQICNHSSNVLSYLFSSFNHLSSKFTTELSDFPSAEEIVQSITDTLVDPELPFPKLRKQTVGIHCNSAYQYFLVDKLLEANDQDYLEETFEQLKEYLTQQNQKLDDPTEEELIIYNSVLCEWFKINYENAQEYLIQGNTTHNLIVLVIALIDLIIDTFRFYVESIKDPLHSFVEFNMRYCLFRNAILSLEEKLSFLFKEYTSYCYGKLNMKPEAREMNIWHIALSKWYLHMHRNHEEYFKMYFYLLRKVNFIAIKDETEIHLGEDEAFIELKNRLELKDIDLLERQEYFELYSSIQEYLEIDTELYKQLIQEYIEYKIDISVNQYSVHWCGFSHHELHTPYKDFQDLFLPQFQSYLQKVVSVTQEIPHSLIALDKTICALLNQLDCDFLKPVTLKKTLSLLKQEIQNLYPSGFQQTQSSKKIEEIEYYLCIEDKKLTMFNNQNNIENKAKAKYSIIIENEDFNKMLKDSSTTTGTRYGNQSRFNLQFNHESSHSIEGEYFS